MRLVLIAGALAGLALMTSWPSVYAASGDKAASLAAFDTVAKVLTHPRCMNCHTTTAWPTQGDKSERHGFNVVRGPDGRGQGGMRCSNCHKDKNIANIPGAKDWHMPPLSQGWTGLTPGALCRTLGDPEKNGNRTGAKILEHVHADALVVWSWTPGAKRTPPPVTHKDFVAAAETWIRTGAHCPSS